MFTQNANKIFAQAIDDYHRYDDVDHQLSNPYAEGTIDKSNQVRTDMVEYIDSYLLDKYKNIDVQPGARINTETPAWAIDRLSILALKIYHMRQEVLRKDVDEAHRAACQQKLDVLLSQQIDLSTAIEELIEDIEAGRKYMKTYKQMKMYNDPALNPVLYAAKK